MIKIFVEESLVATCNEDWAAEVILEHLIEHELKTVRLSTDKRALILRWDEDELLKNAYLRDREDPANEVLLCVETRRPASWLIHRLVKSVDLIG